VAYNTQELLHLRKLTRALADHLRNQLKDHLSTLTPVFRPRNVLGDYVQGVKEGLRGPEQAMQELRSIYGAVTAVRPFTSSHELKPPIELVNTSLEITPVEYSHTLEAGGQKKTIRVTSPFRWILSYTGFGPGRLRQVVAARQQNPDELHQFVLHHSVLHLVTTRQPGIGRLLEAIRFPLSSGKIAEFGELPVTFVSSCVSTVLPQDEVILESTEISGQSVFEEVVDLEGLRALGNPAKEKLLAIAEGMGVEAGR
jgi:hypothetical protein